MTLVAAGSGQISIGGTPGTEVPTNSSIEAEIGGTFTTPFHTTASLNDAAFRSLAGVASGTISLYNFYGKSSSLAEYVQLRGYSSINYITPNVRVGYDSNIYSAGVCGLSTTAYQGVYKDTLGGDFTWARQIISFIGVIGSDTRIGLDSSNNLYMTDDRGPFGLFIKYSSAGVPQWTRKIASIVSGIAGIRSANAASDGSTAIGGTIWQNSSQTPGFIYKYNSAGTKQWNRIIANINTVGSVESVDVDSSGNVYFMASVSGYKYLFGKYNSTGTLQFLKTSSETYSVPSNTYSTVKVACLSTTAVYAAHVNGTTSMSVLTKFDTSGNMLWSVNMGTNVYIFDISCDSSTGDVYVLLYKTGTAYLISKYNTSGVLQWCSFIWTQDTFSDVSSQVAISLNAISYNSTANKLALSGQCTVTKQVPGPYGSTNPSYSYSGVVIKTATTTPTNKTATLTVPEGTFNVKFAQFFPSTSANTYAWGASGIGDATDTYTVDTLETTISDMGDSAASPPYKSLLA